eukprot:298186_1
MTVKRELTVNLLNENDTKDTWSNSFRYTDRIVYLEKLLLYSGCWVFVGRKCCGDYIGFCLVIITVILDITSDYLRNFGPHSIIHKQCDLSTLFILFSVFRHIEVIFRLSFFAFKFHLIWKDPWIATHILNFEVESEDDEPDDDEDDAPVLRRLTSSFLSYWNIPSVPANYDYINQRRRSRSKVCNEFKTKTKNMILASKRRKPKYPFKSQKMYKRIKLHCIVGCILITIVTVIHRISCATHLSDIHDPFTRRLLLIFEIILTIGKVWTNLSMIIFFAVIFVYNFIAIRYIKYYFHRIITSCFTKDLNGSNILQEYDDMYYFIAENNQSVQLWVAWLIFYVALNWWIFLSLFVYDCDIYHPQFGYCLIYTMNLVILTWSGLRVNAEFNALSTNIADITEEVQFGYSRFTQFTQYARLLEDVMDPLDESSHSSDLERQSTSGLLLLSEYNKKQSDKVRSKPSTADECLLSYSYSSHAATTQALSEDDEVEVWINKSLNMHSNENEKASSNEEGMSLVHIARLMQLSKILDSRPCTFNIFGVTFTESGIVSSVAAFVIGKIVTIAMNWTFKLEH